MKAPCFDWPRFRASPRYHRQFATQTAGSGCAQTVTLQRGMPRRCKGGRTQRIGGAGRSALRYLNDLRVIFEETEMSFKLPDLPYAYDALAPYMSRETLEYHHDKHHLAYVNTGNKLLQGSEWE